MGHTISNMTLNYEGLNSGYNCLGFFAKNYGKIYDLNIECDIDAEVTGTGNLLFAGAISGFSYGEIQNCNASGNIDISSNNEGNARIGGLVGQCNNGDFFNCSNETTININQTVETSCGGIVGNYDGVNQHLEKCTNSGSVYISNINTEGARIGGIAGYIANSNNDAYIKNLYNTGEITITNCKSVGVAGICAQLGNIDINNIYNKGNITVNIENASMNSLIGGITGMYGQGEMKNAYNVGKINLELTESSGNIGGICGINGGNINNVYNSGQINNMNSASIKIGAIIGGNNSGATIQNAYYTNYNIEASGNIEDINETTVRKDNLPTILEVINGDNVFENDESGYPIFKK